MSEASRPRRAEAGVVGAGGGTGYLGLLSYLPDHLHWLRDALVFLAPAFTVILGFAWVMLATWAGRAALNWQLDAAVAKTTRIRDGILLDPTASEEDKANANESVAALKRLQLEAIDESVADVRAKLKKLTDKIG